MKEKTSKGRSHDQAKVAAGQDYEVNYEKDKLNKSTGEVKNVIKTESNSREKVETKLKK